jgi:hypothetical protein
MWALAGNVWSFLHRFALGAAILSGGYVAGTDEMGAFLVLIRCHVVFSFYWIRLPDWMFVRRGKAALPPSILLSGQTHTSRS